ncbi:cytochrome P450 [Streptomyces sp. ALI-76-A]|uniref:cytochrome P450 n=1 Tax=Streptomyces sp. ALI-76-A TaxID=3025736 RepID=UPI00256F3082|nr:cytochrome P450 [Streptomyces sp. ALI-76-A]MDL5199800.1 cytochrome P450 [Streptomyces sp. ALI-76-A]
MSRPGAELFFGRSAQPGWFVDMDPPEHTLFRRLLAGRFTEQRMEALRPRVEQIVCERLDALAAAGPPADLVQHLAIPIPSLVICELLGVPDTERARFQRDSAMLLSLRATAEEGAAALRSLTELIRELVTYRRSHHRDDLLGDLAARTELSDEQLAGAGVLLLTAGHDSVAGMLGLGVYALLTHPRQLAALRAGAAGIENTVEELLRYLTVFHFGLPRTARENLELGGRQIRAGEAVTLVLSTANRDPHYFEDPDQLDIARAASRHLALGHGIHKCLGQHLARLEMRIAYAELFRRFPQLELAVDPHELSFAGDSGRYALAGLPVRW